MRPTRALDEIEAFKLNHGFVHLLERLFSAHPCRLLCGREKEHRLCKPLQMATAASLPGCGVLVPGFLMLVVLVVLGMPMLRSPRPGIDALCL